MVGQHFCQKVRLIVKARALPMAVYLLQSGDIGGFHHICHTVQPIGPIAAIAILDIVGKQSHGGLTARGGGG